MSSEERKPDYEGDVQNFLGRTKPLGVPGVASNPISLAQRKTEVLRMLLEGMKFKEIALVLGIHPSTISHYTRDPEFRKNLSELNSSMLKALDADMIASGRSKTETIDEIAVLALEEMRKLIQDPGTNPGVKAKMIDSVLDRTPEISRTKKLDVTRKTLTFSGDALLAAAQAAHDIEEFRTLKTAEADAEVNNEQNLTR